MERVQPKTRNTRTRASTQHESQILGNKENFSRRRDPSGYQFLQCNDAMIVTLVDVTCTAVVGVAVGRTKLEKT